MAKNVGARHTGAKSRAQIRIAPIVRAFIPENVLDGFPRKVVLLSNFGHSIIRV